MAHTDLDTAIVHDCSGWFWWVGAAFSIGVTIRAVGLAAIHLSNRSKQGKFGVKKEVADDFHKCRSGEKPLYKSFILTSVLGLIVIIGLFDLSAWLVLRQNPAESNQF